MKILFITRKYPPQIGGMEKYSYELVKNFPAEKRVIFLNKKQRHLIWWLPYAFLKAIWLIRQRINYSSSESRFHRDESRSNGSRPSTRTSSVLGRQARTVTNFDLIYLCDGLLAPLGFLLKKITKLPVIVTCHGLDVTYPPFLYQKIVISALKKLDKIICVSRATLEECVKRGISREKLVFIPNGVETKLKVKSEKLKVAVKSLKLQNRNINLTDKNILLTVGRLVKRKGVEWFCENVMTKLPENIIYLVVGAGPEKSNIENIIEKYKLKDRVFLLGKLSDEDLEKVYAISDIFIMPNVAVKNDIEGFGLVALEAINYGLPVVAADLEGIRDAIKSGENGILVQSGDTREFIRQINILLKDQEKKQALILRAQKYTLGNFNWQEIAQKYQLVLDSPDATSGSLEQ